MGSDAHPTCIDAFCGAGGLSLGLVRAGFDLRAAFDLSEAAINTYRRNLGAHGFLADASELSGGDLLAKASMSSGDELGLLAGGPPCQGFSKQKRGAHLGDRRNGLVLEFLRLVEEIRPAAFLLENIPQLNQLRGRRFLASFRGLDDYQMLGRYYCAADYGVAQTRERFVLVGVRYDAGAAIVPPAPTTPNWLTVGQAIGDLPEPPSDHSDHPNFPNHQAARVTQTNIERFSHVPQGGGWKDIPWNLRLACHQTVDVSRGGWPDVYGRLRADGQCPTITGGFDSFTRGRYGHPTQDRPLTPREAARLQGFPDEYVFEGTRHDIRHQIGNAVPVPLAEALGRSIRVALGSEPSKDNEPAELVLF
jgi:DNA (cytosine-5)-methyltransferase 1